MPIIDHHRKQRVAIAKSKIWIKLWEKSGRGTYFLLVEGE